MNAARIPSSTFQEAKMKSKNKSYLQFGGRSESDPFFDMKWCFRLTFPHQTLPRPHHEIFQSKEKLLSQILQTLISLTAICSCIAQKLPRSLFFFFYVSPQLENCSFSGPIITWPLTAIAFVSYCANADPLPKSIWYGYIWTLLPALIAQTTRTLSLLQKEIYIPNSEISLRRHLLRFNLKKEGGKRKPPNFLGDS